jgi:chaperonin GroEL (HSP60 family)
VGDGTTTVVILAVALLSRAKEFLEIGYHSSHIIEGFQESCMNSLNILKCISRTYDISFEKEVLWNCCIHLIAIFKETKIILLQLAQTALRTKFIAKWRNFLSQLVIDALYNISKENSVVRNFLNYKTRVYINYRLTQLD